MQSPNVLALLVVALAALCSAQSINVHLTGWLSTDNTPWPKPQVFQNSTNTVNINPATVNITTTSPSQILAQAIDRYRQYMVQSSVLTPYVGAAGKTNPKASQLTAITINVVDSSETLNDATNETYTLNVDFTAATIEAQTVFGAIHALESFTQLVEKTNDGGFQIRNTPIAIHDFPRFTHRGVLIDSARHFLPIPVIQEMIDSMAYNKLNVLHWHIVDSQSFPFNSSTTNLGQGAWSPQETYSPDDLRGIVAYAKARGVRVMAEIDTPGHVTCWGLSYPEILTPCTVSSYPPLDPTNNATYEVLETLLTELGTIFPDTFFHLGGDEVSYSCWEANENIIAFMKAHGMGTNFQLLQQYYEFRLIDIASRALPGRQVVMYQEVFDYGVQLPANVVVDAWKTATNSTVPPSPSIPEEIARIVKAGHRAIAANGENGEWYLNDGFGNGICTSLGCVVVDWPGVYAVDPVQAGLTPEEEALVLGGEVSLWGEEINANNMAAKAWPRASAFAERMWSNKGVTDVANAANRLARVVCKMMARDLTVSPFSPGSCFHW